MPVLSIISEARRIPPQHFPRTQASLSVPLAQPIAPQPEAERMLAVALDPKQLELGIKYQPLSRQVYSSRDQNMTGWEIVSELDNTVGWRARLYQKGNEYCVAFRGSSTLKEFLLIDAGLALGMVPSLSSVAPWLREKGITDLSKVVFTGHSLGGALASAMSVSYGALAYVFESPGLPGASESDLSRVTAFESAANNIVNGLAYMKAGVGKTHFIPLSPTAARNIQLREAYATKLKALYFVQNDITRAINASYLLISGLQNLMDVHGLVNIEESMKNMSAGLKRQLRLNDPEYNETTQSGPYAIQMTYQIQTAVDFVSKFTRLATGNNDTSQSATKTFEADRKVLLQALEDGENSLAIYEKKYNPNTIEKENIKKIRDDIQELKTFLKTASKEELKQNKEKVNNTLGRIKTQIGGMKGAVDKAIAHMKQEDQKHVLELGFEILAGFGIKIKEEEKEMWIASAVSLAKLSEDFNTYKIDRKGFEENAAFPGMKGNTPTGKFVASSLENLQGFFNGMASIGTAFDNPQISKIATIGGSAATIALELGHIFGLIAGSFTPIGAIAAIGMAAMSLFSAFSGKAKKQKKEGEALQKALSQISDQIAALHQEMRTSFDQVFKNQQAILEYVTNAFANIEHNFTITLEMLNSIQRELQDLGVKIHKEAIASGLDHFNQVIDDTRLIIAGFDTPASAHIPPTQAEVIVAKMAARDNIGALNHWMNSGPSSDTFTGRSFASANKTREESLVEMNQHMMFSRPEFFLGHLVNYLQEAYPQSELRRYSNDDVFNIAMWSSAISYFASMVEHDPAILMQYPETHLNELYQKGLLLLSLITDLRKNREFLDAVFDDLLNDMTKVMGQVRNVYYKNAKLSFDATAQSVPIAGVVQDLPIKKNLEVAKARNDLVSNIGLLAGASPMINVANTYAVQSAERMVHVYPSHPMPNGALKKLRSIECWIDGVQHLAVIRQHAINDKNSYLIIEFFNPVTQLWTPGFTTGSLGEFNMDDITVNHTTVEEKKRDSTLYIVGRTKHTNGCLTSCKYDIRTSTWGQARTNGEVVVKDNNSVALIDPSRENGELLTLSVSPGEPNRYRLVLTKGVNASSGVLLTGRKNEKYLAAANENGIIWFIVAPANLAPGTDIRWELFKFDSSRLSDLSYHPERLGAESIVAPVFDQNPKDNTKVDMQVINGKPYIMLACGEYGLLLYTYDEKQGWQKLLQRPDILNQDWQQPYHKDTVFMKAIQWKEGDEVNDGLFISGRSSVGVITWVYSLKSGLLECTHREGFDTLTDRVSKSAIMFGPDWAQNYNYIDVGNHTHVTIMSDYAYDQDGVFYVGKTLTKPELAVSAYTVFENTERVYNSMGHMKEEWLENMSATEPHIFKLTLPAQPVEFNEDEPRPQQNQTQEVELVRQYVPRDADYTYLALQTTRAEVADVLRRQATTYNTLIGEEISTLLLADFVATENGRNIWSWLGDNNIKAAEALALINKWSESGKVLDEDINQILGLKVPENAEETLFKELAKEDKAQKIEWVKSRLTDHPRLAGLVEKETKANQAKEAWDAFCKRSDIQNAYVDDIAKLGNGLAIGWRAAYVYLSTRESTEQKNVHVLELEQETNTAVLVMGDPMNVDAPGESWLLAKDQGYGFSVMHTKGDNGFDLALAAPQQASSMEVGLRGAISCLSDLIVKRKQHLLNNNPVPVANAIVAAIATPLAVGSTASAVLPRTTVPAANAPGPRSSWGITSFLPWGSPS